MELALFDEVGEVVRTLTSAIGPLHHRAHTYGVKVWFGDGPAPREHYEAQVVGPRAEPAAKVLAVEIGFHAEHTDAKVNDEVLARLVADERRWRKDLGPEAVVGPFLGPAAGRWRRISETWLDPDLRAPGTSLAIGCRLADYVLALEALVRPPAPGLASRRRGSTRTAVHTA